MDYVGQGRAEKLYQIIIILFGVVSNCQLSLEYLCSTFFIAKVGLVWGYAIQQFSQTVYILGAGLTLATLLTVPPWPIFR